MKKPLLILFAVSLLSTSILWATERDNPSRLSLYGRNYAGRVLTSNEARSSNWLNISFQANKVFQPPMINKFTVTTTYPHAAEHMRMLCGVCSF